MRRIAKHGVPMEKSNNAGAATDDKSGKVAPASEAGKKPEAGKEETTIGEALAGKSEPKAPKMVPEADLLAVKRDLKNVRKDFKELQKSVSQKSATSQMDDAIAALKKKWPDNSEFIDEFATALKSSTSAKAKAADEEDDADEDEEEEEAPKKSKSKDKEPEVDEKELRSIFKTHFDKTLAAMPEYKDVAVEEVIWSLARLPQNANKSFAKLMEETYGHLLQGKKGLDQGKPGGGKEPAAIDYKRAATDTKYFNEIMADPELKREYNQNIHKRLNL